MSKRLLSTGGHEDRGLQGGGPEPGEQRKESGGPSEDLHWRLSGETTAAY